ncbi:MAG: hypothetical protein ACK4JZ_07455 [Hydrogenophilus thermoluteolus]
MGYGSNRWQKGLWIGGVLALLWASQPANAFVEDEFRPPEEDAPPFDVPETGLFFPRIIYDEQGDDVTRVPYHPTGYNDTAFIKREKFQILKWQQDPPNFVIVFVEDSTPYQYESAEVDIMVRIGHFDRLKNLIEASRVVRTSIPIQKGINRIPINVMNYKGDIVQAKLIGVRMKQAYQPIELAD